MDPRRHMDATDRLKRKKGSTFIHSTPVSEKDLAVELKQIEAEGRELSALIEKASPGDIPPLVQKQKFLNMRAKIVERAIGLKKAGKI